TTATAPLQNLAAEEDVLGAIMLAQTADAGATVLKAVEATGLTSEQFSRQSHGLIYAAARGLVERGEPTDVLALENELRLRGQLKAAGGTERLCELAGLVPATANVAHHASLVVDAAERRKQVEVAQRLLKTAENGRRLDADAELRADIVLILN